MNRTPERKVIKSNELNFKRDVVNQNAEKRFAKKLMENSN